MKKKKPVKPTPVLDAAKKNDLDAVVAALEQGGDPNETDKYGSTPLIEGILRKNDDLVKALLERKADPSQKDKSRQWSPLHFAIQEHLLGIATLLLDNGAQIDAQDAYGNTPLCNAVFESRGRGELITLLRQRGANDHLANSSGVTPRDLAKTIANYDVNQFFR